METITTYEYGKKGRVVRTVSVREPEWDDEQRGWMLALSEYRASLCPCGCGYLSDETRGAANEDRFTVPPPYRCYARDAMVEAQEAFKNPRPQAVLWTAQRL